MNGGSPEPTPEPFNYGSIPPYEYPVSPIVDVVPEQPKRKPELVQPFQRPHKPFIGRVSPVQPVVPEKQPVAVVMSHPETVTLPPTQEVEPYQKPIVEQPKGLTPVNEKELTPVKQKPDEKINGNLTNQPQNVNFPVKKSDNFSPAPTAKKLPKKMQFKGKKGRQRTEAEVRDLLTFVQNRNGAWPNDNYVSEQMRRYYRREYPEYFRKARKGKKVQSHGSSPIELSTRRTGTNA